ncbi:PucR family transcriptional regulator [Bacillus sp. FJAT-18017]|uniref:PucR family transcriptional regulator n=1 Tax=Bacillus sp. FJAT-18017 TaxID=1705566 RepID=UPI001E61FF76|nr:PucR family transcriptional regulator [Bacillus sp. FJAT-18017]
MTVKDILALESFKGVKIIAGEAGLHRRVNNVYFMEVPDIYAFIDQNGFLLTTLYPIAHDKIALESFLPKLVELEISGLGIKIGRYIDEIPQLMIDQANELGLPVLLLADNANLSLLSNGILETLLDKKNTMLEFRDDVHNKLISLLLEGADLEKLVFTLSEIIKAPVLLINEVNELITSSIKIQQFRIQGTGGNGTFYSSQRSFTIQINDRELAVDDYITNSIIAGRDCLGYFIALPSSGNDLSNIKVALEQASLLSAFLFQKEQAVLQRERSHLDSFVRDILNQKIKSQIKVIQKSKIFKWDFDFPVVLLNIEELSQDDNRKKQFYSQMKDLEMVERIISEKLDLPIQKCKVVHYDDGLICFISVVFENKKDERIKAACESLLKYYQSKYTLGISVSRMVERLPDLKAAYEETKVATRVFKVLNQHQPFIKSYQELGVYKLIHLIDDRASLEEYVNSKLGVLVNLHDSDMVEMLSCLIKNNFNLQKTSKELFIHYNTLRYRIDKLRESGIDFNNGFDLAELALAYKINMYLTMAEE